MQPASFAGFGVAVAIPGFASPPAVKLWDLGDVHSFISFQNIEVTLIID